MTLTESTPKGKRRKVYQVNVHVTEEMWHALRARARDEDRPLVRVVRRALQLYLDTDPDPETEG